MPVTIHTYVEKLTEATFYKFHLSEPCEELTLYLIIAWYLPSGFFPVSATDVNNIAMDIMDVHMHDTH